MEKITLSITEPIPLADFLVSLDHSAENDILDSTLPGEWMNQIVPSIYFRQNEFFRIDFNSAIQGMMLNIASLSNKLILFLEFHETPFIRYYNAADNKFSLLLQIDRKNIRHYEKNNSVKFMAVKPKKSLHVMNNMRGIPVGGLIPSLIFRGAFKLAAKAEDDLVEKEGTVFSIFFTENGFEKKIDLIVDSFYVQEFEYFLKIHWQIIAPEVIYEEEKKEGCFIATACYNDYDHPIVFQLRKFRDNFLAVHNWGQKLIKTYYKYSPYYASIIKSNFTLRLIVRILFILPLFYLSKVLMITGKRNFD